MEIGDCKVPISKIKRTCLPNFIKGQKPMMIKCTLLRGMNSSLRKKHKVDEGTTLWLRWKVQFTLLKGTTHNFIEPCLLSSSVPSSLEARGWNWQFGSPLIHGNEGYDKLKPFHSDTKRELCFVFMKGTINLKLTIRALKVSKAKVALWRKNPPHFY